MSRRTQYQIWVETFKPIKNSLASHPAGDGCQFETYGPELEHVLGMTAACPEKVWTLLEGHNGQLYISQGYRLVNRVGYFLTENPFDGANPEHVRRHQARDVLY
jgi:hypothetical protein